VADATIVAALAGAGGVLAGSLVSGLVAIFREQLVGRREREARVELRAQQRADERAQFQRESILEWLDATADLYAVVARTNEERIAVQVETGHWPDPGAGARFPDGFLAAYSRLGLRAARLFDPQLRETTKRLQAELGEAVVARTAETEWMRVERARVLAEELQDRANMLLDLFFGASPGGAALWPGRFPELSPRRRDPGPSAVPREDGAPVQPPGAGDDQPES
jgi:hypothetical protein